MRGPLAGLVIKLGNLNLELRSVLGVYGLGSDPDPSGTYIPALNHVKLPIHEAEVSALCSWRNKSLNREDLGKEGQSMRKVRVVFYLLV